MNTCKHDKIHGWEECPRCEIANLRDNAAKDGVLQAKMMDEIDRLREALMNITDPLGILRADQMRLVAGAALAPRSERREGEPAWTMQGCPECHGTGKEGTGTPSGEGGEDFRECFRCQGTGFVPFPAPPAAPKEEA